jgi:phosphohistidine swiveling domain-containing protein
MVAQQPQTLPLPDNFPIKWETPEDARLFWQVDLMHWPHGLSPLAQTIDVPPFIRGFNLAVEELCMPMKQVNFKPFNHYVYTSVDPWSHDPNEMQQRMAQMQAQMMKHIPGLYERWAKEYEPEVRAMNEETLNTDYAKLSDRDISVVLEKLVANRERSGQLHFLAVLPAGGATVFFEEVYTNLFGAPQSSEHLQLLQGFRNKSTEVGDNLWHLSVEARKRPQVLKVLRETPPEQIDAALAAVEGGPAFRDAVQEYTKKYGWRAKEFDLAEVTWREQPAPVYALIREYASRDDYDPEEEFKSLVAAREVREKVLIEKVAGGPVEMFKQTLAMAQQYLPIQEDHNFWIDQMGTSVQRMPTLEAGRRLVKAGRINDVEDVYLLHYDELQGALRGGKGDLREIVQRRRADRENFRNIAPPAEIGTTPPTDEEDPFMTKFFGGKQQANPDPRIINGNAASAGKVTGIARVILSLDDAGRLKNGEILVCPATMPPWTPLFALAAAVVTDHGGVLSHTAIVAREYRIPAVVGTKLATSLVQDGQTITVDGTAGTVTMES